MNQEVKDRGLFVVGFLATVLAFTAFKDEFKLITIGTGVFKFSLLFAMELFFGLLALSAYLYALDYLRYSFGEYQNLPVIRHLSYVAHLSYILALLLPISVTVIWIAGILPPLFIGAIRTALLTLFVGSINILALLLSRQLYRLRKQKEVDLIEKEKSNNLEKALLLFGNGFYGETITEVFKAIESTFKEKLLDAKNISSRNMIFKQLSDLAIENKLMDKEQLNELKKLQQLRNQAVHLSQPLSKEDAQFAIDTARKIFDR